ncbi:MAG: protein kinase [Deltaproteobacteria bacterium]|nr:protein kinase [Deltaproteobacteria bacterium]
MATDDELAQTATAPAKPSTIAAPPRAMIGRFRIEGILGQGGMGVVHAAFDPELERKIALKVLRKAGNDDARARLLREARAMAKLSHPNVINVFDVGSADGEDFVAMELVDGGTLGDWLGHKQRDTSTIVAAFVAAGHGLAAAHAAGLVHRDFKPSNVLRSHAGKIVVTDFGLARADQIDDGARASSSEPTSESTRTRTGAILGTPAYMAPEQWTGGPIAATTDQFAFCVALWEALARERPYRGETLEELRTAVLTSTPRAIDKIPRPLRAILRRGLEREGAQRWPSMQALLAALDGVGRRRRHWTALAAGVGVLGILTIAVFASRDRAGDDCSPPALDPSRVWSTSRASALALRAPEAANLVASDIAEWEALRSRTCAAVPELRPAKLACLDATLSRIDDALASALIHAVGVDADDLADELVDPAMCDRASPPRVAPMTPELSLAFKWLRYAARDDSPMTSEELASAGRVASPCARAIRMLDDGVLQRMDVGGWLRGFATLRDLGTSCEDDKVGAAIALRAAEFDDDPKLAEAAVSKFPQADVRAAYEVLHARRSAQRKQWDPAFTHFTQAIELYGVRGRVRAQVKLVVELSRLLRQRGLPEDITRIVQLSQHWLRRARGADRVELEKQVLYARWQLGDVARSDLELERLHATAELANAGFWDWGTDEMIGVTGEVVDDAGAPVANAMVSSGAPLVSDSATAAVPHHTVGRWTTRTDADGRFSLVLARGTIIAQSGVLRSSATAVSPRVRLIVRATGRVEGTVALGTTPASRIWVVGRPGSGESARGAMFVAPVRGDGSFSLDGVPRGPLVLGAVETGVLEVGGRPQSTVVSSEPRGGIALALTPPLYVIGRTADLVGPEYASLWLFSDFQPGSQPSYKLILEQARRADTFRSLSALRADQSHVPPALVDTVHTDDMFGTFSDRPEGIVVVCGVGYARKQFASAALMDLGDEFMDQAVACTRVAVGQSIVTLSLPPLRKFEKK